MIKDKKHTVYHYEEIVVGGNMEAVVYAYISNLPLLFCKLKKPFELDYFEPDFDLSNFKVANKIKKLVCQTGEKYVGIKKRYLFDRLLFMLCLAGQVPFHDNVVSINVDGNALGVATVGNKYFKIQSDKITLFDDESVTGLPANEPLEKIYKVYDWVSVRSGTVHEYDLLETDEDFVNQLYFYPSDRIDGNHNKKDAVSVSLMTEEQISDIDYSDIYVRFKVLDMMKSAGIKGRRNGRDVNNPDRIIYRAIKIEMADREIVPLYKNIYQDINNINFNYQTEEEIIEQSDFVEDYAHKLNHFLFL